VKFLPCTRNYRRCLITLLLKTNKSAILRNLTVYRFVKTNRPTVHTHHEGSSPHSQQPVTRTHRDSHSVRMLQTPSIKSIFAWSSCLLSGFTNGLLFEFKSTIFCMLREPFSSPSLDSYVEICTVWNSLSKFLKINMLSLCSPILSEFPIHRHERSFKPKLSPCVNEIIVLVRSWGMASLVLNLEADGYEQLPQQSIQALPLKQSPHPTTRNSVDPQVSFWRI